MWPLMAVVALLHLGSGLVLESSEKRTLQFPTEYHFTGENVKISTRIIKPFEIWYSDKQNRSRQDFYHGLVKRYYVKTNKEEGDVYYIHPKVTEDGDKVTVCTETVWSDNENQFLPSSEDFNLIGQKRYNNREVDVWEKVVEKNEQNRAESRRRSTLYTHLDDSGDVPVLLEYQEVGLWQGAITEHTLTHYYNFQTPSDKDLIYDLVDNCTYFLDEDYHLKDRHRSSPDLDEAFERYKIQHRRSYSGDEHRLRRKVFEENWRRVTEHNTKNPSYRMAVNQFSDRTAEELASRACAGPPAARRAARPFPFTEQELAELEETLPENFDLRTEGLVTRVKNQGSCGSCWAFATVGAVESALARRNGGLLHDLSEQSLVDCAWESECLGCDGGFIDNAYDYVLKHGIPKEREYGDYLEEDGVCHIGNVSEVYRITGYSLVTPLSVTAMKAALYHYGPVTVTINANDDLMHYFDGIYNDPECIKDPINHAVIVVGYGVREGSGYWVVRNSWGEDWGMGGYALFAADNVCHILEGAYYPVV